MTSLQRLPSGVTSCLRFVAFADVLMYCEEHAGCGAYTIIDPVTKKEVKYVHRYFVDDSTGISDIPRASKTYEHIGSGMQAAAVGGSFLSISNNAKKTAVLTTKESQFPKDLKLIHLSGVRLTCDRIKVKPAASGSQRDLGWQSNMNSTNIADIRSTDQHAINVQVITDCKRSSTTSGCSTEVLKKGYEQKILGTLQNPIRVEHPTHSSAVDLYDMPMADGVCKKLNIEVEDKVKATMIIGLAREHGGLGFPLASDLAAKSAGIEIVAAMEGRNKNLKSILRKRLASEPTGVSQRISSWLEMIGVTIHGGDPPIPVAAGKVKPCRCPTSTACRERDALSRHCLHTGPTTAQCQDEVCKTIMTEANVTEENMLDTAACSIHFPDMLLRLVRENEVVRQDDGSITGVKLKPKDVHGLSTVEATILHGSTSVKSQWMSTTRSVESILKLCANQRNAMSTGKAAGDDASKSKLVVAILDEQKCNVAHDLSCETGRENAELSKGTEADALAARYNEVLLADTEITSGQNTAVLDFFDLEDIFGDDVFARLDSSKSTNILNRLPFTAVANLAKRLEIGKNRLRSKPTWNINHDNRIVVVSDASVKHDEARDHRATDACHTAWKRQTETADRQHRRIPAYLMPETEKMKESIKNKLKTAKARTAVAVCYVYWDHDDPGAKEQNAETGWHLTGMFKMNDKSNAVQLCQLTNTAHSDTNCYIINALDKDFQRGMSPTMFVNKYGKQKHNIWASKTTSTLMWHPAFSRGGVWEVEVGNGIDVQLPKMECSILECPPMADKTIFESFESMHKVYRNKHRGLWHAFSEEPDVAHLLTCAIGEKFNHSSNVAKVVLPTEVKKTQTEGLDFRYIDCVKFGFLPSVKENSLTLARYWLCWQTDKISTADTNPVCTCFSQNCKLTDTSTCSHKKLNAFSPDADDTESTDVIEDTDEQRFAMLDDLDKEGDSDDDDDDWDCEHFTCTCGERFKTNRLLKLHRHATNDDSVRHQQCASELPVAGGAFVIYDMRTMRPIAAEMVDCTSSTCSPSSSTQAEIQTAVQGLRRLLMFDLTGCNVETYCDNAALELRTARILHQFSSRRQVIKMSELGLSKAFADLCIELNSRCLHAVHHWRGAEHNLAYYADRALEDFANLIADHFAGVAATTSAKQSATIARTYDKPNCRRQNIQITVKGSQCNAPIKVVMGEGLQAITQNIMRQVPPNNADNAQAQYHQHCEHAAHERIDFKSLKKMLQQTTPGEQDAFDRHTMDCTMLHDKVICSRLPKTDQVLGRKLLHHLRAASVKDGESRPCLLCSKPYSEGKNLHRMARHMAYACSHFRDQRRWLEMATTSILYRSGRCFHADMTKMIGFIATESVKGPQLFGEDAPYDKHDRIIVESKGTTQKHSFDSDTLDCNWNNRCAMPARLLSRAKSPSSSRECFLENMVRITKTVLKCKMVKSIQPHPAVLTWLVKQYKLQQQHDCTPMNCTAGLFKSGVHVTATLRQNSAIDSQCVHNIGMYTSLEDGELLLESSFLSIETTSPTWRRRLKQASVSVASNHDLTMVCMVSFNGAEGRAACRVTCRELGGIEILHCPEHTLTIVDKNGFIDNVDRSKKVRTSKDFRQEGHKTPRQRQPAASYIVDDHDQITGPTRGKADSVVRHKLSSSESETVFIVFQHDVDGSDLYEDAADKLAELCSLLAHTNPTPIDWWQSSNIHWTACHYVELSIANMLQHTTTAQQCLEKYRQATETKVDNGMYFENKIKLGFSSSMSHTFLRNLGATVDDTRETLAKINSLEATFLDEIETKGEKDIVAKLQTLGLPYEPTDERRVTSPCLTCSTEVGRRFDVIARDANSTKTVARRNLCIICAAAIQLPNAETDTRPGKRKTKPSWKTKARWHETDNLRTLSEQSSTISQMARTLSSNRTCGTSTTSLPNNSISPIRRQLSQQKVDDTRSNHRRKSGEEAHPKRARKEKGKQKQTTSRVFSTWQHWETDDTDDDVEDTDDDDETDDSD